MRSTDASQTDDKTEPRSPASRWVLSLPSYPLKGEGGIPITSIPPAVLSRKNSPCLCFAWFNFYALWFTTLFYILGHTGCGGGMLILKRLECPIQRGKREGVSMNLSLQIMQWRLNNPVTPELFCKQLYLLQINLLFGIVISQWRLSNGRKCQWVLSCCNLYSKQTRVTIFFFSFSDLFIIGKLFCTWLWRMGWGRCESIYLSLLILEAICQITYLVTMWFFGLINEKMALKKKRNLFRNGVVALSYFLPLCS